MLYSLNGSYPTELPERIRLSDGTTRTNKDSFTDEDITDAGYVLAPEKPETDSSLSKVDWDGENWITVELTQEEKDIVKSEYLDIIRPEVNELLLRNYRWLYLDSQGELDDIGIDINYVKEQTDKLEVIESTYSEETNSVEWPVLKDVTVG